MGTITGRACIVATPADVTGTTPFLASPGQRIVTGQIVIVDGGMILA